MFAFLGQNLFYRALPAPVPPAPFFGDNPGGECPVFQCLKDLPSPHPEGQSRRVSRPYTRQLFCIRYFDNRVGDITLKLHQVFIVRRAAVNTQFLYFYP